MDYGTALEPEVPVQAEYPSNPYTPEEANELAENAYRADQVLARNSAQPSFNTSYSPDTTDNYVNSLYNQELANLGANSAYSKGYSQGELKSIAARNAFDKSNMEYGDLPANIANMDPRSSEYADALINHMNEHYDPSITNNYIPRFLRNLTDLDKWTSNDFDTAKTTANMAALGASFIPGMQPLTAAYYLGTGLGDINSQAQAGNYTRSGDYLGNAGRFAYDLGATALQTGLASTGMSAGSSLAGRGLGYTGIPMLGRGAERALSWTGQTLGNGFKSLAARGQSLATLPVASVAPNYATGLTSLGTLAGQAGTGMANLAGKGAYRIQQMAPHLSSLPYHITNSVFTPIANKLPTFTSVASKATQGLNQGYRAARQAIPSLQGAHRYYNQATQPIKNTVQSFFTNQAPTSINATVGSSNLATNAIQPGIAGQVVERSPQIARGLTRGANRFVSRLTGATNTAQNNQQQYKTY